MAIRAIWGFDHLPQLKTVGTRANCYGLFYAGYSLSRVVLDAAASDILLDASAISCMYGSATPSTAVFKFELGPVTDGVSVRSHIGFTITRRTNATTLGNAVIVSLGGTVPLVYANEYPNVVDVPVQVELTVDRVDKKIVVYINNKIVRIIKNAAAVDSWNTNNIQCGLTNSIVRSMAIHFKDFIFIDDTQDATQCTRPGNRQILNHRLTSVSSTNWSTAEAIDVPISASVTTPLATSDPETPTPLNIKIANNGINGYTPTGIVFITAMSKTGGTAARARFSYKVGTVETVVGDKALMSNIVAGKMFSILTSLANLPLSQVNTANFIITPVAAT